ncbi:MAG: HdeD family acid-resistance protein [Prevotella sp.]
MKTVQTSFIRAIIAIVVGLLLIKYREDTVTWITIIIGVLFFISGLISCIVYLVNRNAKPAAAVDVEGRPISLNKPTFPVVGIGSLVLGVALAAFPNLVVNWMVYIFGAILILGAVGQYVTLASVVKLSKLSLYFWLMPSFVFVVGLIALFKPSWIASAPLLFLGWAMVFYGVVECANAFKIMNIHRQVARIEAQQQAESEAMEADAEEIDSQDETETSSDLTEQSNLSDQSDESTTPTNNTPEGQDNPNLGAGI